MTTLSLGSIGSISPTLSYLYPTDQDIIYDDNDKAVYTQIGFIGQGTYGLVYLAQHINTKRKYVIKQMKKALNDEGITPSQLREISLLKSMNNKYVIKVEDIFFTDNKYLCLVFEQCLMDLSQYINNHKNDKGIKQEVIKVMCIYIY